MIVKLNDPRLSDRFWRKVYFESPTGCFVWTASGIRGYGRLKVPRTRTNALAHRYAYSRLVKTVPKNRTIDHLCFNRACVNVLHMEVVTRGENTRRGNYRRWAAYERQ